MDTALPKGTLRDACALKRPADYLEILDEVIPKLLHVARAKPEQIVGVGIDFTSSTVLPVKQSEVPLCVLDAYKNDPHAYVTYRIMHVLKSLRTMH